MKQFARGQDFAPSATFLNDLIRMLDDWKSGMSASGPTPHASESSQTVVAVKNNSGEDALRFGVLGLDAPIISPDVRLLGFKNEVAFKGISPSFDDHWGRFCVTLRPIPNGSIGEAVIAGVVPCKINVFNADHGWADVRDGDPDLLNSDDAGFARILWKQSGVGEKWAYVHLGCQSLSGFCVAQEDCPPNNYKDFKFSTLGGSVYGNATQMFWPAKADEHAGPIKEGKVCFRQKIGNVWIVSPLECPEEIDT